MVTSRAVRPATAADREAVFGLATRFATSFSVERESFDESFEQILALPTALLIVADDGGELHGYALAFVHPTFFANAPVVWLEEVIRRKRSPHRHRLRADRGG